MPDAEWPYNAALEYHCAPGRAFNDSGTTRLTLTLTCDWDKAWKPYTELPLCDCKSPNCLKRPPIKCFFSGTHCAAPPLPGPEHNLVPGWDGLPIEFDSEMDYICDRGMKFKEDFNLDKQIGTCRKDNKWELPPEFYHCAESKI